MADPQFFYPVVLHQASASPITINAPAVSALPFSINVTSPIVYLYVDGPTAGLYFFDANNRWRYVLPALQVSVGVIDSYALHLYYQLPGDVTNFPANSIIYRNGAVFPNTTIVPGTGLVYIVMEPLITGGSGSGTVDSVNNQLPDTNGNVSLTASNIPGVVSKVNGETPDGTGAVTVQIGDIPGLQTALNNAGTVKAVNSVTPDGTGNVALGISDIPNLAEDLANAGTVKSVNGATPDGAGNAVVPVATPSTAGTVIVATGSNLAVDGSGHLSAPVATTSTAGVVEIAPSGGLLVNGSGVVSVSPGAGAFAFNQTIYVDPNGSDTVGTGGIGYPFQTIAHALSTVTTSGAEVLLSPGMYAENVVLGTAPVSLRGTMAVNGESLTQISGYIQIAGAYPALIEDVACTYVGTGAQLRVLGLTGTEASHVRNVTLTGQSSQQAVQTDATMGVWSARLNLESLSVPAGSMTFAAGTGTVVLSMAEEPCASILTVSGGVLDIKYADSFNEVVHTDGSLFLRHIDHVGTSTSAPAIASTAGAGASGNNILWLGTVNTWYALSTSNSSLQSYVQKSGTCSYVVQGLTRNLAQDTWAGTQIFSVDASDLDLMVTRAGVNYTGAAGASLNTHLAGIDAKLGGVTQTVTSANSGQTGAVALVNTTVPTAPVISQLVPGTNVSFVQGAGYVTVNVAASTNLTSQGGGTAIIYNASGVLKTIAAGTNITISDNGSGLLTFNSTASSVTTTVNTFSGTVTIAQGSGINITNNAGTITVSNSGLLSLSTATGTGGVSPVYAAAGVLKYLVAGSGMSITDNGSGVLTFTSSAPASLSSQGTGTSLVYNTSGVLKTLTAGTNLSITDDGAGNLTINYATSSGQTLLTGVSNATNSSGQPLVSNSGGTNGVAVVRQLVAGTNMSLSQSTDGTAVIISSTGGVSTVNGVAFAVTVASGTGISVNTVGQTITVANTGLTAIQAVSSSDTGAISLVAATTGTTANIKQVVAGTGITMTDDGTAVTVNAVSGYGTVTSVNNIDPTSGNVTLGASDVGAIPITGTGAGAVSGAINMGNNAISNLPDATANGMPITYDQLFNGSFYIDQGVV